ncbi:hypothetical protein [Thalassotalea euphylliae]|uniref:Uncharacterized protein n=1 Tax=Thalassotalea euphylliae TaxID=1655234 RepID=A0A3E0U5A5_9GAMM|nr:hypothetical protein [Thalassotalea euphylliae]REL32126.1 hypothetical protein DXX94_16130 [Thalassotalea euphylliae]
MNNKLKGITSAIALSTVGLCFAVSHAAPTISDKEEVKYFVIKKVSITTAPVISANKHFDALRGVESSTLFQREVFAQMFDKPLVRIPLDQQYIADSQVAKSKPQKTNDFFALATVLNDKLQQFIAKFTQSSPSYSVNEEGVMALNKPSNETCNVKKARF